MGQGNFHTKIELIHPPGRTNAAWDYSNHLSFQGHCKNSENNKWSHWWICYNFGKRFAMIHCCCVSHKRTESRVLFSLDICKCLWFHLSLLGAEISNRLQKTGHSGFYHDHEKYCLTFLTVLNTPTVYIFIPVDHRQFGIHVWYAELRLFSHPY